MSTESPEAAPAPARVHTNARVPELNGEHRTVVDLVTAALVDPALHTDTRMRLHHEISGLIQRAHEDVYGPLDGAARHAAATRSLAGQDHQLAKLIEAVLVDPNVHTDLRMRLCHEIPELVRVAHEDRPGP